MIRAEYREHYMGAGNPGSPETSIFRVWTEEDAAYGSFQVVTKAELRLIIKAFYLMHGQCVPAGDAHIAPIITEEELRAWRPLGFPNVETEPPPLKQLTWREYREGLIADGDNEAVYVIVSVDNKFKLTWNTRGGITELGKFLAEDTAKQYAKKHHNGIL